MAGILTLDLSFSGTGWALMRSPDAAPLSGVWALKAGLNSDAEVFHKLRCQLHDLISLEKPRLVAYEAPRPPSMAKSGAAAHTTFNTFFKLIGLCAIAEEVSHAMGVAKITRTNVMTVRKHFCGSGHAKKDKVMATCRSLKWRFVDDNAADALALLHYQAHKEKVPGYEFPPNTLFSKKD